MESAFSELPLALFTTFAPAGAGAFMVLCVAAAAGIFDDARLKRMDKFLLVPFVVALVGFIAAFFHLASPLHAFWVFMGTGSSPLSNEIVVGMVFMAAAFAYLALGMAGKLSGAARRGFAAVVALAALVFACFIGAAYMMETIASWSSPLSVVQVVGYALVSGSPLALLVMALESAAEGAAGAVAAEGAAAVESSAVQDAEGSAVQDAENSPSAARRGSAVAVAAAVLGAVLALAGLGLFVTNTASMSNALVSGSELATEMQPALIAAAVLIVIAAVGTILATRLASTRMRAVAIGCFALALVGVFAGRLVFYGMQLSVGLSIG